VKIIKDKEKYHFPHFNIYSRNVQLFISSNFIRITLPRPLFQDMIPFRVKDSDIMIQFEHPLSIIDEVVFFTMLRFVKAEKYKYELDLFGVKVPSKHFSLKLSEIVEEWLGTIN